MKSLMLKLKFVIMLVVALPVVNAWSQGVCPDIDANATYELQATAINDLTVTNVSPDWFNFEDAAGSPTIFNLIIQMKDADIDQMRLRVTIWADTAIHSSENSRDEMILVQDRVYRDLGVPQGANNSEYPFVRSFISNEVFDLPVAEFSGDLAAEDSDIMTIIASGGRIPEMDLVIEFRLVCNQQTYAKADLKPERDKRDIRSRLRYVNYIRALSPGTSTGNPRPVDIFTVTPSFVFTSDLYNSDFLYQPGEAKFTVFLYSIYPGESVADALDGIELATFDVESGKDDLNFPIAYPPEMPPLEIGETYVWRVRANLRGPVQEYKWSNPLYFRISTLLSGEIQPPADFTSSQKGLEYLIPYADDYHRRLFAALKIILGENYDIFVSSMDKKLPVKGQIRLNGQPFTLDQIEELAKRFLQDRHTVTRIRFQ